MGFHSLLVLLSQGVFCLFYQNHCLPFFLLLYTIIIIIKCFYEFIYDKYMQLLKCGQTSFILMVHIRRTRKGNQQQLIQTGKRTHTCLRKRTQIKCQFIYLTCSIKQIAKIEMKNTINKLQSVYIFHVKCSVYYPHIRSLIQFFCLTRTQFLCHSKDLTMQCKEMLKAFCGCS